MPSSVQIEFADQGIDGPRTLLEVLGQRVSESPDSTAYTFLRDGEEEEASLSYRDLDRQARGIGEALIREGLQGERALLLYPPGLAFISGFFGCLYAGLIPVPAYPPDPTRLARTVGRLEAIAADSGAKVALTTQAVHSTVQGLLSEARFLRSIAWLESDAVGNGRIDDSIWANTSGETIAFLQYTSGSTGRPRGVILTNSNLIQNAAKVRAFCRHDKQDRYVSWLPLFHDMGFMSGVLQPLYSGIPAVLLSPAAFLERPVRWLKAISRYRATTSGGPNFAYDLCVRKVGLKERRSLDLSSWAVAFNGAEPVRSETLEQFAESFGPFGFDRDAFYPCYGLAEATLMVTGRRRREGPLVKSFKSSGLRTARAIEQIADKPERQFLVSCGRPSRQERLVIVDPETMASCPSGQIAEIWISGPSVGQGYWNRPTESEETFRAYVRDTGEGPFLRTGDLGFLHGDELFLAGRLKDLIIIRGQNHYPQDIELTVEKSHPALRPGCGAAFPIDVNGEERLSVVQEVDDHKSAEPVDIVESIRRSVTEQHEVQLYAAVLVKPGTIPKTSSGKIRRSECKKQFLEGKLQEVHRSIIDDNPSPQLEQSFLRTALAAIEPEKRLSVAESYILAQAARVLGLAPGGLRPERPLSALGLDSLTALELKNQIEAELGIAIPASKLLEGASAREIATLLLDELTAPNRAKATISSLSEGLADEYGLSFTQKALWFTHQLAPESAAYNIAFAVRINSLINVPALAGSFRALVDRHPCLRTTFAVRGGQPVQQVQTIPQSYLLHADASLLGQDRIQLAITDEAYRPFDLERGPVCRMSLFTRSPVEAVLLLTMHHIVSDGWSFWVLLDDLIELYASHAAGVLEPLPAGAPEYSDYVRWQQEMLGGEAGERLFEYWKRELSGNLPALDLPTSRPRPRVQTYSGASYGFKLDRGLVSAVRDLALSSDATVYMVLLAAFQVLLHRHTGQDDVLVGSPISARSRAEFAPVVGCFFNAVVLRACFHSDMTFEEFLTQVQARVYGALDHQEYPSHVLVERIQPVRDPSRPPLFQATFILQRRQSRGSATLSFGDAQPIARDNGLALSFVPIERRQARMDLELEMIEAEGAIHAWLHYNRDLFDAPLIARMADHYRVLLRGIVSNPNQRLSDLPLLTEHEIRELLLDQTLDQVPYDHAGLEEVFREQVAKSPERVATVYADSSITFGALDKRSNQLAGLINKLVR